MTLAILSSRIPSPFPQKLRTKLVFENLYTLTTVASTNAVNIQYAFNGPDDPFQAGTGDWQPYGYAQLAALYSEYIVLGAHVECEFYDPSADGMTCGLKIMGTAPAGVPAFAVEQQPWVQSQSISNTGEQKARFSVRMRVCEAVGLTEQQYQGNLSQYAAFFGNNPSVIANAYPYACGPGSGTPTITVRTRIIYDIQCFSRKTLAATQHA